MNTLGGEITVLIQGSGTSGRSERLPWRICFVWLVDVRYWGGGTMDVLGHPIQLIVGLRCLKVV